MPKRNLLALLVGIVFLLAGHGRAIAQDAVPQPPQVSGQSGQNPKRIVADRQLQRLIKILNLTSDQQRQIKLLLVEREQKLNALFQDRSLSEEDRNGKAKAIVQDAHSKIDACLTAEQKPKFESILLHVPNGDNE
jgi:hypothetical protein